MSTVTVKKSIFDFETLTKKPVEVQVTLPEPLTQEDELSQFKTSDLLKFANKFRNSEAKREARAGITGLSASVVLKFISTWRAMPQYKDIEPRAMQTTNILSDIKTQYPALVEVLKQMSEAATATETEDDDDNDE